MSKIKTIGLISPASAHEEGDDVHYRSGIAYLKSLGFSLVEAPNIFDRCESLNTAGDLQTRADAFHKVWSNPDVDLVLSMRGGYGCIPLLDKLDFDLIKKNPKPLLGYSDLTALHLAFYKFCGFQSFHSPMTFEFHKWKDSSKESFLELLEKIPPKLESRIEAKDLTWVSGSNGKYNLSESAVQSGTKIMGGNMTIICCLIGTKYLPSFKDSILFLEEYNEPKYKVDRMVNHLIMSGTLDAVKEIWVGIPEKAEFAYESLEAYCLEKGIKLLKNIPVGHSPDNYCLPLG